jgi:FAD/FMN-containing dehydrogenase/Fe-S oxidoreductase
VGSLTDRQRRTLADSGCELRSDALTRTLYATDASIYRIEPAAVAFPRSAAETAALLRAAAGADLSVIPRGAGTGLAGGALGDGVVVDLARHSRSIDGLDLERRTVRVGAGVVLDQLNAFLRPHGLWFGPDVATSSRATLGGMIASNSSGAHAPVYGTTADHVEALEAVLADGTVALVGRDGAGLETLRDEVDRVVATHAAAIADRLPDLLVKHWPGYGLDEVLRHPGDLTRLLCGSEGTLAAVSSAVLRVVPLPTRRSLGIVFFASMAEAMAAAVELLELEPAAIEHIDRPLVDQTRGQREFRAARALLGLDEQPCESILVVELFGEAEDRLEALLCSRLGSRRMALRDPAQQELVWGVRRAGLSLLTGCPGPAKPATGIEDVCVRPRDLPAYVAGLQEILARLGLSASFYGHVASGELHVRPVLDLHRAEDVARLRRVADEVADLCRRFGGSIAAEHGLGIARTEYLEGQIGPELVAATAAIKRIFDASGVLNPGKVVDDGRYRIDRDLRLGPGSELVLPFAETVGFVDRDRSFAGNLEQCNGCGGCRKDAPTMCPTFVATGEEIQSTRGRANTIRAVLEGRLGGGSLEAEELAEALDNCLSCKACRRECPSNVDLALLKAELLHARHRQRGVPLRDRVIGAADSLGRLGTIAPWLANAVAGSTPGRRLVAAALGLDPSRPLPAFARQRFDRWFAARPRPTPGPHGKLVLWDDTWVRYHEPGIGRAAVAVLEAAGYELVLAEGRRCCGRPAASRGLLDEVRRLGEHNLALLRGLADGAPVVFLEPSCYSMFIDEYRQLRIPGAAEVAARCVLFEELLAGLLAAQPDALVFRGNGLHVAIHGHCHTKALGDPRLLPRLVQRIPGARAELLATGCCGMAGAFGMMAAKQALSRAVASPLVEAIAALPEGTRVVACGTSCRAQVRHLTPAEPLHMAELLAASLA